MITQQLLQAATKVAPALWDRLQALQRAHDMLPNDSQKQILREFCSLLSNRRVLNARVVDDHFDPVVKSLDEIRLAAYQYAARLHDYPRGQVMVEVILDAIKTFLGQWAMHLGKGYTATYPPPVVSVPSPAGGSIKQSVFFMGFADDLVELRNRLQPIRQELEDLKT